MRSILPFLILVAMGTTGGLAQMSQPMVGENTTKISDHVWAIMGFPNIAIVVGAARRWSWIRDWARKMAPRSRAWPQSSRPTRSSS